MHEEATCDEEKQVERQDRFLCRIQSITNTLHTSSSARLLKANLRAALAVVPLASPLPGTSFGREEPQSCVAGLRASVQTTAGVISGPPSSSPALLERASATGPGMRVAIAAGRVFQLELRRQLFSRRRAISLSIVICREVRIGREPS